MRITLVGGPRGGDEMEIPEVIQTLQLPIYDDIDPDGPGEGAGVFVRSYRVATYEFSHTALVDNTGQVLSLIYNFTWMETV